MATGAAERRRRTNADSAHEETRPNFLATASLNRTGSLRDQVYALIRKGIVTGKLGAGAPINEIEIAARLGISRTPVREAVKRISDEGLIEVFAQIGTFVAEISRKQVEEAYVIRIALEIESIRRAVAVIDTPHVHDLEDIIHAHETALRRTRFDEALARDDDFHRTIAEINGLSKLWKVVDMSKAQMDRCRVLYLPSPGAGQQTIAQHRTILQALARRDPEASVAALKAHLDTSLRNTLTYLDAELVNRSQPR